MLSAINKLFLNFENYALENYFAIGMLTTFHTKS